MRNYCLGKNETYPASSNTWAFKKGTDIIHGINLRLSNMVGGFPFECLGYQWKDSERLYLCGEFSNNTEEHLSIQKDMMEFSSGFAAKKFCKNKHKDSIREDFNTFRLEWMLWCVWQKCAGNGSFRKLLLTIPSNVTIVENTTTDHNATGSVWGCANKELESARKKLAKQIEDNHIGWKKKDIESLKSVDVNRLDNIGEWVGENNMGKVLMICRDSLRENKRPDFNTDLLNSANIYIMGKKVVF